MKKPLVKAQKNSFGNHLRSLRISQGITLRSVAKAVNKTPTYISDIENGNNKPPTGELLQIIIKNLKLENNTEEINKLYDLAADERKNVPEDVKDLLLKNKKIIDLIRFLGSIQNNKKINDLIKKIMEEENNGCNTSNCYSRRKDL